MELAPSHFSIGACIKHGPVDEGCVATGLHEPTTYIATNGNDDVGVLTFAEDGKADGMIRSVDGKWINLHAEAASGEVRASEMIQPKEAGNALCGTRAPNPPPASSEDKRGVKKEKDGSGTTTSTPDRKRRAAEPWFGDNACYSNDDTTRAVSMGVAVTALLQEDNDWNTDSKAEYEIGQIFAKANLIFTMQLNVVLVVGHIYFSSMTDTSNAEIWDNYNNCQRYKDSTASNLFCFTTACGVGVGSTLLRISARLIIDDNISLLYSHRTIATQHRRPLQSTRTLTPNSIILTHGPSQ
jgi:hypothetical protein